MIITVTQQILKYIYKDGILLLDKLFTLVNK